MFLTVGEISKAVGISAETIRYYVKEGLITPHQNEENGYWEYSSDDLMRLTDILFYRTMDLNMKQIKAIMGGLPLEEIGSVIDERKAELIQEIKAGVDALHELTLWEADYKDERALLGKFRIGAMPPEFRRYGCFEEPNHMARYLAECFDLDKENWGSVSLSFYYNIHDGDKKPQRYLSVEGSERLKLSNVSGGSQTFEEKAEHCIITEVHYSDNVFDMIQPIIDYAAEQGLKLEGGFYGREDTNYFIEGKRTGLYKIYAPILAQ